MPVKSIIYYSRPDRMAEDAFCPSWATPSIEFAIRLWRSPKQLKAFGVGENYCARGGFSSASQRCFSERSRIADKFKRRRAHNGRNASAYRTNKP